MKNYRRNYSKYTLDDMERELVRLANSLLNDQRHTANSHDALELKRLLTLMVDLYRQGENTSVRNEQLIFE